jgi:hypothetical protein
VKASARKSLPRRCWFTTLRPALLWLRSVSVSVWALLFKLTLKISSACYSIFLQGNPPAFTFLSSTAWSLEDVAKIKASHVNPQIVKACRSILPSPNKNDWQIRERKISRTWFG